VLLVVEVRAIDEAIATKKKNVKMATTIIPLLIGGFLLFQMLGD